jgi:hypothetical protein
MMNLALMGTIAAVIASITFWVLLRIVGGKSVFKRIEEMEQDKRALAIYLSVSKFAIFFLYATVFTRF